MRSIRQQAIVIVLAILVSIGVATAAAKDKASSGSSTTTSSSSSTAASTTASTSTAATTAAVAAVISSMSPANGATIAGKVAWSVSATGADHIDFLVDGTKKWTETRSPYMFNGDPDGRLDTTTLSDGTHVLKAVAYDASGGSTSATSTVTVKNGTTTSSSGSSGSTSTGVPQAAITQPGNGQTLSGAVSFVATASGATVAKITFAIDGQVKWTEYGSPYMFNGDPDGRLDTRTLTNGTHTLSAAAYGTDGRSTTVSISVTVSNASSGGTAGQVSSSPWKGWSTPSVPAGAIAVTSATQLRDLLRSCPKPGAAYNATSLSATFTTRTVVDAHCPDGQSETFFLGSNVKFASASLLRDPAVDVMGAQNVVIYGGDVSNPSLGPGVVVRGYGGAAAKSLRWWGFRIHDTAQNGLFVYQSTGPVQSVDFRGDISRWSLNLSLDPHAAKGTGLHGAYIGISGYSTTISGSTFVLNVHDGQYGNGVQLGPGLVSDEVQVHASNLPCNPPQGADGTCGNAVALFGSSLSGLTISDVEASSVRRGVEASGLSSSLAAGTVRVTYGRVTGYRLNPYDTSRVAVVYTNCL